jgi:hypothetical protein
MPSPRTKQEVLDLIAEKANRLEDVQYQAVKAVTNKNKILGETLKEEAATIDVEIMRLKVELWQLEKS